VPEGKLLRCKPKSGRQSVFFPFTGNLLPQIDQLSVPFFLENCQELLLCFASEKRTDLLSDAEGFFV
jgi:hypothetical protein